MRSVQAAVVVLVFLAVPAFATASQQDTDEQAIRRVVSDFASTWNAQDMQSFGLLFADSADFTVITGKLLKGRREIESYHAALTAQLYKDSRLTWTPLDMRFLRPDVALVHVATEISFNQGKEKRTSVALVVLTKERARWLIASVQNTLTSGPPVAQPAVSQPQH